MNLLIPAPVRPNLAESVYKQFAVRLQALVDTTTEAGHNVDVVFDRKVYPRRDGENFFARFARLRNDIIREHLKPHHTDVLWIDADIIDFPATLALDLREASPGIVSPIVLIEGTRQNYDTAGMRESYEERSRMYEPWFDADDPLVELYATGACVMVPARVHRSIPFVAQSPDDPTWNTEWTSVCEGARRRYDIRTHVLTDYPIYHANLPDYGEAWH